MFQNNRILSEFLLKLINPIKRLIRLLVNSPIIDCDEQIIGKNVTIEPNVFIRCKKLILGDGVIIKSGTRIEMDQLIIGDYSVINNNCYLSGTKQCEIGHNCWIGHYSVIDSIGTTKIGNGVGIGAHSQLWSHIYFGDILEGCKFASEKKLIIEDDVWFTGHCIVSPIHAKKKSMAMVGSLITKDMDENQIYAGSPAKNISDKIGTQFVDSDFKTKSTLMTEYINTFYKLFPDSYNKIEIVENFTSSQKLQFNIKTRTYSKLSTDIEYKFMRYLLPVKAKFNPINEKDWVSEHYTL